VARARVRAACAACERAGGPRLLGFLRQTAAALWDCHRIGSADAGTGRANAGALLTAAACFRLDPPSRLSGSPRRDVPEAMEQGTRASRHPHPTFPRERGRDGRGQWAGRPCSGATSMTPRELVLATIRRSLGVTGAEATRQLEAATRLAAHPRGTVPARGRLP